jgi:hypothetical protein
MKEYKETYNGIEYSVFELRKNELYIYDFVEKVVKPLLHHRRFMNCIVRKLDKDDKLHRIEIFKDGKRHNECGPAVIEYFYKAWWLNGERYYYFGIFKDHNRELKTEEYKNEIRKIRLDEILI